MATTIKFLTEAQAREIRKAISKEIGSRKSVFPRKGLWIITHPLSHPNLKYHKDAHIHQSGILEQSLVFVAGRDKIRRGIPTIEQLKDLYYIDYGKGKIRWGDYKREL